jgi:hypothetical protein
MFSLDLLSSAGRSRKSVVLSPSKDPTFNNLVIAHLKVYYLSMLDDIKSWP